MRTCIICLKPAPSVTFTKHGTGINEICDDCLINGKVGKFIKNLIKSKDDAILAKISEKEEVERKVIIKDLTIKRLQQDMRNAKCQIDKLTSENDKLSFANMDLSFKEQSFKENDSQISLLNELVNTEKECRKLWGLY